MSWKKLGSCDPDSLTNVRLQCHHAVQLLTRAARGYILEAVDDSHSNLGWEAERGALVGRPVESVAGRFQVGLQLAPLQLLIFSGAAEPVADFPLPGKTLFEAESWLAAQLAAKGLMPERFDKPLHFEIPVHSVAGGTPFAEDDDGTLAELSRYFGNAAELIAELAGPEPTAGEVRCWPHHFDVATLIRLEESQTIGVGLSPGDGSYPQPYFYVSPWPPPESAKLPPLKGPGAWHTEGWTGAVLTGKQIVALDSQAETVREFLADVIEKLRAPAASST